MPAPLAIGIVFETHESYARAPHEPADFAAEYEPVATIEALEAAIRAIGHRPVRLGTPHALLAAIGKGELPPLDAALSIAEGRGSRNREAWAPVLLEMAGVPRLGSDALTLSTSLDKLWTLERVAAAGVPVLPHTCLASADDALHAPLPDAFPLFVKPRWEGTAKGVERTSVVHGRDALAREVARIARDYAQPALVEAFAPGAEYTVTVVGSAPPRALPVLQRALERESGIGLHALERAGAAAPPPGGYAHHVPGALDAGLEARLGELALTAWKALECRDFARIDFKLDRRGEPALLEINTLPTFAPDGSFGVLAELAGTTYEALVGEVLAEALARLGLAPGRAADGA
ncbi:MAG: D-alanine--D-alanine ligase [Myxococcota bacterium]